MDDSPYDRVGPAAPVVESNRALKEWAAVEQLLAAGRSILLLRKGGLWERRDGFEMEHRQFWLFPTLFHQNPQELKAEHSWTLEAARSLHAGPDAVRLEHFAVVSDAFRIENLERLRGLGPLQALTEETIENRFHYRNRPYLHALLLRVYRLTTPHTIPNTLGYEGCVSWVELDAPLPTSGIRPVLSDAAFGAARAEVLSLLQDAAGVIPAI